MRNTLMTLCTACTLGVVGSHDHPSTLRALSPAASRLRIQDASGGRSLRLTGTISRKGSSRDRERDPDPPPASHAIRTRNSCLTQLGSILSSKAPQTKLSSAKASSSCTSFDCYNTVKFAVCLGVDGSVTSKSRSRAKKSQGWARKDATGNLELVDVSEM